MVKLKNEDEIESNLTVSARAGATTEELEGCSLETRDFSDRQDNRGSITFTAQWVAEANLTGVEPEAVENSQQSEGEGEATEGDGEAVENSPQGDEATDGDQAVENNPQEGEEAADNEAVENNTQEGEATDGDNADATTPEEDPAAAAAAAEAEEDATIQIPDAVAAMDFGTQRIIVGLTGGDIAARDNDNIASRGNNLYLLQYNSQDAARRAYMRYTTYDNVAFVAPDSAVTADAEGDGEDGNAEDGDDPDPDQAVENNPQEGEAAPVGDAPTADELAAVAADGANLETIDAEGAKLADESSSAAAQLIALIDSGAPWHANVLSRATALDDEELGDLNGHGTAMLEAILAQNPDAQLISIRALDANAEGTAAGIYAAIMQAVAAGATIINLSLSGAATEENAAIADAIKAAREAGIEVIASAGNNNAPAQYFTPGNAEGSFTVGAADQAKVEAALAAGRAPAELTADDVRQATSNYGEAVDAYVIADSTSYAAARTSAWLAANAGEGWQDRLAASELTIGTLPAEDDAVENNPQPEEADDTITAAADDEPLTGHAYALFQAGRDNSLYFFRSNENFTNGQTNVSVTINSAYYPGQNGQTLVGTVYSNFEDAAPYTAAGQAPWYAQRDTTTRVVFYDRIKPQSMAYWFTNFSKLKEFVAPYSTEVAGKPFNGINLLLDTSDCTSFAYMLQNCAQLFTIDLRGLNTGKVGNWSYAFSANPQLTYVYLDGLTTGTTQDKDGNTVGALLTAMLYNNARLTNVDLTNFDTSKVGSMESMFHTCPYLVNVKIPNGGGNLLTNTYAMFYNSPRLTDIDLTNFNTSHVTNMNLMFEGCSQLATLDLSSFSTASVTTSMGRFFGYQSGSTVQGPCWRLRSIKFGPNFDWNPVKADQSDPNVRVGAIWLPYGSGSVSSAVYTGLWESDGYYRANGTFVEEKLYLSNAWNRYDRDGKNNLGAYTQTNADTQGYVYTMNREIHWQIRERAYAFISDKGDMKFFRSTTNFANGDLVLSGDTYTGTSTATFGADGWVYAIDETKMFQSKEDLPWNQSERDTNNTPYTVNGTTYYRPVDVKTVSFYTDAQQMLPLSTAHWFEGMTNLKTVTNLNRNMSTHVTVDMTAMFKDCTSLMNISFGNRNVNNTDNNFQTSSVQKMTSMFENCESLPSLNLTCFQTASVESFEAMFKNCKRLQTLTLNGDATHTFVVDNATTLRDMFYGCERLQKLDISAFNVRKVTDMGGMFGTVQGDKMVGGCNSLVTLTTGANFNFFGPSRNLSGDKIAVLPRYLGNQDNPDIDPMGYYTGRWTMPDGTHHYWSEEVAEGRYTGTMAGDFTWQVRETYAYAIFTPSDGTLTFFRSETKGLAPNNTDATVEVDGEMKTGRLWWGYQDGTFKGFEAFDGMNTTYENTPGYAYVAAQGTLPPWNGYLTSITRVEFVNQIKPKSLAHWFFGMSNLYEININGNLDMSECVSMNSTFEGCNNLFYVDLAGLDTSKVTNMVNTFWNCQKLAKADIGSWDTSSVLCFNDMFGYCYSLTELDFSNWDTSRAAGPIKHAASDRYGFNRMFYDCPNLKKVTFGENFSVTGNGMTGDNRFILPAGPNNQQYTANWIAPNGKAYTNAQLRDDYMINNNPAGVYTLEKRDQAYALLENNGRLQFFREAVDKFTNGQSIVPSQIRSGSVASGTVAGTVYTGFEDTADVPWINDALKVKSVYVQNTIQPVSMKEWFSGMSNLTTFNCEAIGSNKRCFDTTLTTDMSYLFNGCTSLLTTSASSNLQTFIGYLNTSKVTTMRGMFAGCSGITQLNLTTMRTFWLEDATSMFNGCSKLETLTFKATTNAAYHTTLFTTERVKQFTTMFNGCSKLSTLDLGFFSTASATAMRGMFDGCTSMRTLTTSYRFSFQPEGITSDSLKAVLPDAKSSMVYSGEWLTPAGTKMKAADITASYDGTMDGNFTWATGDSKAYAVAWSSLHPESDDNTYDTLTFFRSSRTFANNVRSTRVEFEDGRHRTVVGRVFAPNASNGIGFETYENTTDYGNPYALGYHTSYTAPPWYSLRASFTNVNFLDEIAPLHTDYWFSGFSALRTIDNMKEKLDLSQCTSMHAMFHQTSRLAYVDMSNMDVSNVKTLQSLFHTATGLTEVNVSGWDTSSCRQFYHTFYNCPQLTKLDLYSWDSSMNERYGNMFASTPRLKEVRFGPNWSFMGNHTATFDTVGNRLLLPTRPDSLNAVYTDKWITPANGAMTPAQMQAAGDDLDCDGTFVWEKNQTAYAVLDGSGALRFFRSTETYENGQQAEVTIGSAKYTGTVYTGFETGTDVPWAADAAKVTLIEMQNIQLQPESVAHWFANMTNLQYVNLNGTLDTSRVQDFTGMFENCSSLRYLCNESYGHVGVNLNFRSARSLKNMFKGCTSLLYLAFDNANNNTDMVEDASGMFEGCADLYNIVFNVDQAVGGTWFRLENCKNFSRMFYGCANLAGPNARDDCHYATGNLPRYDSTSYTNYTIPLLRLDNLITKNATDMGDMFTGCTAMERVRFGNGWSFTGAGITDSAKKCYLPEPPNRAQFTNRWKTPQGNALPAVGSGNLTDTYRGTMNGEFRWEYGGTLPYAIYDSTSKKLTFFRSANRYVTNSTQTVNIPNRGYITGRVFSGFTQAMCNSYTLEQLHGASFENWNGNLWTNKENYWQADAVRPNVESVDFADIISPRDTYPWFHHFDSMTSFEHNGNLDMSRCTGAYQMFDYCGKIKRLDLSGLDMSQMIQMPYMFRFCRNLTYLNLDGWDTQWLADISWMFYGCNALTDLRMDWTGTPRLRFMTGTFRECASLVSLDLSSLDTRYVQYFRRYYNNNSWSYWYDYAPGPTYYYDGRTVAEYVMFYGCNSLREFITGPNWTWKLRNLDWGHSYSAYLPRPAADDLYTGNWVCPDGTVATNDNMIRTYKGVQGRYYCQRQATKSYAIYDPGAEETGGTLYFFRSTADYVNGQQYPSVTVPGKSTPVEQGTVYSGFEEGNAVPWAEHAADIRSISFNSKIRPQSTAGWFADMVNLRALQNTANLDTSLVQDMSYMFTNCSSLADLDLSTWNTSNVTTMEGMFQDATMLTNLRLIPSNVNPDVVDAAQANIKFRSTRLQNMARMFSGCNSLATLDLRSMTNEDMTTMADAFAGTSHLYRLLLGTKFTFDAGGSITADSAKMLLEEPPSFEPYTGMWLAPDGRSYSALDLRDKYAGPYNGTYEWQMGASKGYALIEDNGTMTFFRSDAALNNNTVYEDIQLDGRMASGRIFANFENARFANNDANTVYWYNYRTTVRKVVFQDAISPLYNTNCWFYNFDMLEEVQLNGNLHTSLCTEMAYMFAECDKLTYLDLTGLDTHGVTNMNYFLYRARKLEAVDLSSFNVPNNCSTTNFFVETNLRSIKLGPNWTFGNQSSSGFPVPPKDELYTGLWVDARGVARTSNDIRTKWTNTMAGEFTWQKNTANTAYALLDQNNILRFFRSTTPIAPGVHANADVRVPTVGNNWAISGYTNYSGTVYTGFETGIDVPWAADAAKVYQVVFQARIVPESVARWFAGMTNVRKIDFGTNNATGASTYDGYSGLRKLDTYQVTSMEGMFADCAKLTAVDITGLSAFNVTDISNMFSGCTSLRDLTWIHSKANYAASFAPWRAETMVGVFRDCLKLRTLNFTYWDTSRATDMADMFTGCRDLSSVTLAQGWSFKGAGIIDVDHMALLPEGPNPPYTGYWKKGSTVLPNVNLRDGYVGTDANYRGTWAWDTAPCDTYATVLLSEAGNGLYDATFYRSTTQYADNNTTSAQVTVGGVVMAGINAGGFEGTSIRTWNNYKSRVRSVRFVDRIVLNPALNTPDSGSRPSIFNQMANLQSFDAGNGKMDLRLHTSMNYYFWNNPKLTDINLKGVDVSTITTMDSIFESCTSLPYVDLSDWDTSHVTNMWEFFYNCQSLLSADLSGFDTYNVTTMKSMFYQCFNLASVNVKGFDTSNVTDISYMFTNAYSLSSIDISGWNTSKVTTAYDMFGISDTYLQQTSLTYLDMTGITLANCTDVRYLFYNQSRLRTLLIPDLDLRKVPANNEQYMWTNTWALNRITLGNNYRFIGNYNGWVEAPNTSPYTGKWTAPNGAPYSAAEIITYVNRGTGAGTYTWETSSAKAYAVLDANGTMTFYRSTTETEAGPNRTVLVNGVTIRGTVYTDFETRDPQLPVAWADDVLKVREVRFENMITPDSTANWFAGMANMTRFTTYASMDVTSKQRGLLDTRNTTSMAGMFRGCTNLLEADLGTLNTDKVTTMADMFNGCENMASLSLNGFHTPQLVDASGMFKDCKLLYNLRLGGLDTRKATRLGEMFTGCEKLETIYLGMHFRFKGAGIQVVDQQAILPMPCEIDPNDGTWYSSMSSRSYTPEELRDGFTATWAGVYTWNHTGSMAFAVLESNGTMTYFRSMNVETTGTTTGKTVNVNGRVIQGTVFKVDEVNSQIPDNNTFSSWIPWYANASYRTAVKKAVIANRMVPRSILGWFYGASNLETIEGIENIDMRKCINAEDAFSGTKLTEIDVSSWDVSSLMYADHMFANNANLKKVNMSGWNSGQLQDMRTMFLNDTVLESVDMSGINTSSARNMGMMFQNCTNLKSIELSFDGRKLSTTDGGSTPSGSSSVSNTGMSYMFSGCTNLVEAKISLNVPTGTALSGGNIVTNRYAINYTNMFEKCSNLRTVDFSGMNNDSSGNTWTNMFTGCTKLNKLVMGGNFFMNTGKALSAPSNTTPYGEDVWLNEEDSSFTGVNTATINGWTGLTHAGTWVWKKNAQAAYAMVTNPDTNNESKLIFFRAATQNLGDNQTYGSNVGTVYGNFENTGTSPWREKADTITSVQFDHRIVPVRTSEWFSGLTALRTTPTNWSNLDMMEVRDAHDMFSGCVSLTTLNLTGLVAPNLQNANRLFADCSALATLDLTAFDTLRATDLGDMFSGCGLLRSVTLGQRFSFKGDGTVAVEAQALLPQPQKAGAFNGTWQGWNGEAYSSEELRDGFNPTLAGTFSWGRGANSYATVILYPNNGVAYNNNGATYTALFAHTEARYNAWTAVSTPHLCAQRPGQGDSERRGKPPGHPAELLCAQRLRGHQPAPGGRPVERRPVVLQPRDRDQVPGRVRPGHHEEHVRQLPAGAIHRPGGPEHQLRHRHELHVRRLHGADHPEELRVPYHRPRAEHEQHVRQHQHRQRPAPVRQPYQPGPEQLQHQQGRADGGHVPRRQQADGDKGYTEVRHLARVEYEQHVQGLHGAAHGGHQPVRHIGRHYHGGHVQRLRRHGDHRPFELRHRQGVELQGHVPELHRLARPEREQLQHGGLHQYGGYVQRLQCADAPGPEQLQHQGHYAAYQYVHRHDRPALVEAEPRLQLQGHHRNRRQLGPAAHPGGGQHLSGHVGPGGRPSPGVHACPDAGPR